MKRTMKMTIGQLYRVSDGLDRIARFRSLVNLKAACDASIVPSDIEEKEHPEYWREDELAELQATGLQQGITLAIKATAWDAVRGTRIWIVSVSDGADDALFFFVGTYQEIAAKLRELPDES